MTNNRELENVVNILKCKKIFRDVFFDNGIERKISTNLIDDNTNINAYAILLNTNQLRIEMTTACFKLPKQERNAILAHELGHLYYKHSEKTMRNNMFFNTISVLLIVFLSYFTTVFISDLKIFCAILALQVVLYKFFHKAYMSKLSQRHEYEADSISYSLYKNGMIAVLNRFDDYETSIFSSHPSPNDRKKALISP